ncbi:response regulator [Niallia circulans]
MYRVLIIEDEKLIRKWLRYGFDYESVNCVVIGEASDGEEGIELINELKPDIVITDINMPRKMPFKCLKKQNILFFQKLLSRDIMIFLMQKRQFLMTQLNLL